MRGLPPPLGEVGGIGFVAGDAVPALEDLLASAVVPRRSGARVVDPRPVGVVARGGRNPRVGSFNFVELALALARV